MRIVKNFFVFDGVSSLSNLLTVEDKSILGGAEPDLAEYEVPGRDGTVFVDQRRRKNVVVTYDTFLKVPEQIDIPRYTGDIKRWLLAKPGVYRRLEDTYDPDHFRFAVYAGGLEFDNEVKRFTRQTITFHCLPFRYRRAGEVAQTIPAAGLNLQNDTGFDAMPLITIGLRKGNLAPSVTIRIAYEDGTAYECDIGGIAENQGKTVLDSAEQIIFGETGQELRYNRIDVFPKLQPGKNKITVTGDRVLNASIAPRWREL